MMTHDDIERKRNALRYYYAVHITAQNHTKQRRPHNKKRRTRRAGHTRTIQRKRQRTRQTRTDTDTKTEHRKEEMERHMMMTHDDIERRRNALRYHYATHITAQNHTKRRGPHNGRKRARRAGHTGTIQRNRQKTRQTRIDTETEAEGTQTDTENETERTQTDTETEPEWTQTDSDGGGGHTENRKRKRGIG